jgi:hypothetical protein
VALRDELLAELDAIERKYADDPEMLEHVRVVRAALEAQ